MVTFSWGLLAHLVSVPGIFWHIRDYLLELTYSPSDYPVGSAGSSGVCWLTLRLFPDYYGQGQEPDKANQRNLVVTASIECHPP